MKLYNTLTRSKQEFVPIKAGQVSLYTCGPTVYDDLQIGNWRNQVFNDLLTRTLRNTGLKVNRVMNITNVGHLVSDGDEGEDKLEKGAKREGKSVWQIAEHYTDAYYRDLKLLNIQLPNTVIKATDAIKSQIDLIKILIDKDFAYPAKQAIYFDVGRLADYGKLSSQNLADKEVGARKEVVTDPEKRHPQDFALWFFTVGHYSDHEMRWPSPWGDGFPGWHLECSAIIHQSLGEPIDIHTGGVDHIGTHHTNEIAQSEAAYGKRLANFWLHNEFLLIDGQRMGKSLGNFITLNDVIKHNIDPLALRMLYLQAHYRSQQNFTWEALGAANNLLSNLRAWADLSFQIKTNEYDEQYKQFVAAMEDDLNTPKALVILSQLVTLADAPSSDLLEKLDSYLGLELSLRKDITAEQKQVISERQIARESGDFIKSDKLRDELLQDGLEVDDIPSGSRWRRKFN